MVLDVMFSFVMNLANNFDAFLTSKVNPSFSKTSFLGACEVVVSLLRPGFIPGACYITSLHTIIGLLQVPKLLNFFNLHMLRK